MYQTLHNILYDRLLSIILKRTLRLQHLRTWWVKPCLFLVLLPVCSAAIAQSSLTDQWVYGERYLARIGKNSPEDLERAFLRAEQLYFGYEKPKESPFSPVVMVLHGPEVGIFFDHNYERYKHLVDLAARLTAFGVVDIRVCLTRMKVMGEPPEVLVPFVGTVPFGPKEEKRLKKEENYLLF